MNRHQAALRLADDRPDIEGIAQRFLDAVREAKAENVDPGNDPAVLLLGTRIAFMTHADVTTSLMHRRLIDLCEAKETNDIVIHMGRTQ